MGTVMLSAELVELLDKPLPQASQSALLPRLNAAGQRDIAMVEAIMASGDGGHVAYRRRTEAPRDTGDLATNLGTGERRLVVSDGHKKESVGTILGAELHAGAAPPLVLIARDLLTEGKAPDDDEWDEPVKSNPATRFRCLPRRSRRDSSEPVGSTSGAYPKPIRSRPRRCLGSAPASVPWFSIHDGLEPSSPIISA